MKRYEVPPTTAGNIGYGVEEQKWLTENCLDMSWITPEIAREILQRMEKGCLPIMLMQTNRYNNSIYGLISKKATYLQRTYDAEVFIKNTTIKGEEFDSLLIFVTGKDKNLFFEHFTSYEVNRMLPKITTSKGLTRIFSIDTKLRLWNFHSVNDYKIFSDYNQWGANSFVMEMLKQKANESSQVTEIMERYQNIAQDKQSEGEVGASKLVVEPEAEEESKEEAEEVKSEEQNETKKPRKKLSQIIAERKANPIKVPHNASERPRFIPSYERKFQYVLQRYGQSFDSLLLPMSELESERYYAQLAEQEAERVVEEVKRRKKERSESQNGEKRSRGRPKQLNLSPEELRAHNRELERQSRERRKQKEAEYLQTLTPEEREAYLEEKRVKRSENQARYYQNKKARIAEKKQAMSPEELAEFEAQEEAKKEHERAKNRERNARRRAKLKAQKLAQEQAEREKAEQEKLEQEKAEREREEKKQSAKKSAEIRAKVAKKVAEREAEQGSEMEK